MSAIDPGVEDEIQEAGKGARPHQSKRNRGKENRRKYTEPNYWWFASTACPLLAGTLGPIASGFNICALAYEWRVYVPPGSSEHYGEPIKDPPWVIAINAVSLLSAVVGNASLLMNMARRLKFSTAQPITISGFLLAGILLVADVAALASKPNYGITDLKAVPSINHALSQAFYYAIIAASVYIVIGLLLCVTVYGAVEGRAPKDFRLTNPQQTLMLQTMSFIAYLLLGAVVYSNIEGWHYLDAFYWADVTVLTVGLGDWTPATQLGRGLLFPFAIGGIIMLGLVVSSIRSLILEHGKEKFAARILEKRRKTAVHGVEDEKETIKVSVFSRVGFTADTTLSTAQRREEEFRVMRRVQEIAERERRWMALAMSFTFAVGLWLIGAAVFMRAERSQGWTYFQSVYFAYVALLTMGYGDFSPQSNSGKPFFVVWSLLAVPSLTILISDMADTVVKLFSEVTTWIGSITVLPDEGGFRASVKASVLAGKQGFLDTLAHITPGWNPKPHPGTNNEHPSTQDHASHFHSHLSTRLASHLNHADLHPRNPTVSREDDTSLYHYVLIREMRTVIADLHADPNKKYSWHEWEYFLRLMSDDTHHRTPSPQTEKPPPHLPNPIANTLSNPTANTPIPIPTPTPPQTAPTSNTAPADAHTLRRTSSSYATATTALAAPARPDGTTPPRPSSGLHHLHPDAEPSELGTYARDEDEWSWLSRESPVMDARGEPEWILDGLAGALERGLRLGRGRRAGVGRAPVGWGDVFGGDGRSGGGVSE